MYRFKKLSERARIASWAGLSVLLFSAAGALASERDQGIQFAREGRCELALENFGSLDVDSSQDALVSQLTGECALRLKQFDLAESALIRARSLAPSTNRVNLHLAIAHYHQGEISEAAEALERAAPIDGDAADFSLYSGLVAFEQLQFETAARALETARQSPEASSEPMASFFLGRTLVELDRFEEAEAAFDRVVENFPGTVWAEQAVLAKDNARAGDPREVSYWGSLELGFEHDDNVLLRGNVDDTVARELRSPFDSGQSDQRGYWFLDAGASTEIGNTAQLGGIIRYGGVDHVNAFRFDSHAPGATLWLDRLIGEGGAAVRLQYDLDGVWVDEDPFVVTHLATTSLFKPWEKWGHTVLSGSFVHNQYYYTRFQVPDAPAGAEPGDLCPLTDAGNPATQSRLCGPNGLDERSRINRTGNGATATLFHQVPIPLENPIAKGLYISGEYLYHRYWARGAEYDHQRHQIEVEVGATLPLEVELRVGGRFARILYDNNSVFPDPGTTGAYFLPSRDRRETETGLWVRLQRALTENIVLAASYRRTRNRSNTEVFDYVGDVVGASIRVAFGD